jgi:hypothetical protein
MNLRAMVLLLFLLPSAESQERVLTRDIESLSLQTGKFAEQEFERLLKENADVQAADGFFRGQGLELTRDGLTYSRFVVRRAKAGDYEILQIPYSKTKVIDEVNVTIVAIGPKGISVRTATLKIERGTSPQVEREHLVANGKVQPVPVVEGKIRAWLRCMFPNCSTAFGLCALSDGGYPKCVAASCGLFAIACAVNELF